MKPNRYHASDWSSGSTHLLPHVLGPGLRLDNAARVPQRNDLSQLGNHRGARLRNIRGQTLDPSPGHPGDSRWKGVVSKSRAVSK